MNNQPMKRRNPFASPINIDKEEEKEEKLVEKMDSDEEEDYEVEKEEKIERYPAKQKQQQSKQQQRVVKSKYNESFDDMREKYTSTMDTNLRRKIKIICATRGIMFSEFIEEACKEKISREGGR